MKKQDNQHLDFLISQYVDGCLDGAGKKSVEQTLLTEPTARALYTEHREVQDMLDDWGNRIPLIHWDEFDKKLADRLEKEEVGSQRGLIFRRWLKPVAAAAALFLAASLGYAWHGWSEVKPPTAGRETAKTTYVMPRSIVAFEHEMGPSIPSEIKWSIDEAQASMRSEPGTAIASKPVEVSAPEEAAAVRSLKETIAWGIGNLQNSGFLTQQGNSAVAIEVPVRQKDERDDYQP